MFLNTRWIMCKSKPRIEQRNSRNPISVTRRREVPLYVEKNETGARAQRRDRWGTPTDDPILRSRHVAVKARLGSMYICSLSNRTVKGFHRFSLWREYSSLRWCYTLRILVSRQKGFGNRINSVSVSFKNVCDMSASELPFYLWNPEYDATNLPALTDCTSASYIVERNE
jgi:hypothetical protein